MYKIEICEQWSEGMDFCLFHIGTHRCEIDWGFEFFLFGVGVVFRFK